VEYLGFTINPISISIGIGLILVVGLAGGRLAGKLKLPAITGYLLAGILLSPKLLHIIPEAMLVETSDAVTPMALSVIAYIIGGSLSLSALRGLKKSVAYITLFEGVFCFIAIFLLMAFAGSWLLGNPINGGGIIPYLGIGLLVGAAALPTAPAATIAVLHESGAKGVMTTTLLSVVALDDAMAVIIFALVALPAASLINGTDGVSLNEMLLKPVLEIGLSVALGLFFALVLIYISRYIRGQRVQLTMTIAALVLLCGGVAEMLSLSLIIANMAFGFAVLNISKQKRLIDPIIGIEDLIFVMFFTIAGTHFDFGNIALAGILGVVLLLVRSAGKYAGVWTGAKLSGAPDNVRKYMGLGLFPMAGVTIGLIMLIFDNPAFDSIKDVLLSGILASVIINELIAPPLMKMGIFKAGEGRTRRLK